MPGSDHADGCEGHDEAAEAGRLLPFRRCTVSEEVAIKPRAAVVLARVPEEGLFQPTTKRLEYVDPFVLAEQEFCSGIFSRHPHIFVVKSCGVSDGPIEDSVDLVRQRQILVCAVRYPGQATFYRGDERRDARCAIAAVECQIGLPRERAEVLETASARHHLRDTDCLVGQRVDRRLYGS